jgi:hypothetical protein
VCVHRRHAQIIEDETGAEAEGAHHFSDRLSGFLEGFKDADGEAAQAGEIFRAEAGADANACQPAAAVRRPGARPVSWCPVRPMTKTSMNDAAMGHGAFDGLLRMVEGGLTQYSGGTGL